MPYQHLPPRSKEYIQLGKQRYETSTCIYKIILEATKEVVWIGATKNPQQRWNSHRVKTFANDGPITLIIVEIVPDPIWKEREQYWMSFYRALEAPLRNRATGGHGRTGIIETAEERMRKSLRQTGKSPTLKTRARMSAANTGKKLTNETRKKLSAALTGKTVSQKTRDKLSTALKGRSAPWVAETNHKKKGKPLSESHRAAISAAHTGVPHPISKSAREKTGAALRGRKRPADVVAKVANAHKGLKHTKESRKKMRLSHLGKKRSPESIAKQVATIRAKIAAKEQHPN